MRWGAIPQSKIRLELTDIGSCSSSRVYSDNDSSSEPECERRGPVGELDPAVWIRMVVGVQLQERGGLRMIRVSVREYTHCLDGLHTLGTFGMTNSGGAPARRLPKPP